VEEDIKVLEEYLNYEATKRNLSGIEIQAIENLIARNKELEELLEEKTIRVGFENKEDYIPKSKVREIIQKYYNEYEKEKEYRYTNDVEDEQRVLREIEKELLEERN